MTGHVLDDVPFNVDLPALEKKLHMKQGGFLEELSTLAREAEGIARPKGFYRIAFIDEKDPDGVVVDGIRFRSRVLRVNLDSAHRVFPYVATCGREMEAWAESKRDPLERFWAEAIKEAAVRVARERVHADMTGRYQPGSLSRMGPGSLADWPIQEQKPLFELLGDMEKAIGVRLLESMLMMPTKTVSGIWFPTEVSFESCQLCPREECPGRRAVYDPSLYDRKYREGREKKDPC
jgi:hypothetical protein